MFASTTRRIQEPALRAVKKSGPEFLRRKHYRKIEGRVRVWCHKVIRDRGPFLIRDRDPFQKKVEKAVRSRVMREVPEKNRQIYLEILPDILRLILAAKNLSPNKIRKEGKGDHLVALYAFGCF